MQEAYWHSGFDSEDVLALSEGLLFGSDEGFSVSFKQLVRAAGVSHLVAASGANLSFALIVPGYVLRPLGWWYWMILSPVVLMGYWHLAEPAPSLWRALVMWGWQWLALMLGYQVNTRRTCLLFLGCLWLLGRNYWTAPGLWLSFFAVTGVHFSRVLKPGEKNAPFLSHTQKRQRLVWGTLLQGSLVWLFVQPLIWYWWQESNPLGILATWSLEPWLPGYQWLSLGHWLMSNLISQGNTSYSWLWTFIAMILALIERALTGIFQGIHTQLQWMVWTSRLVMVQQMLQWLVVGGAVYWLVQAKAHWSKNQLQARWRRQLYGMAR